MEFLAISVLCVVIILTSLKILYHLFFFSNRPPAKQPSGLAVFVSGCDSGIGQRAAAHFCELGWRVFAGCLDPDRAALSLPGCDVLKLDVTDEESVRDAVDRVRSVLKEEKRDLWCVVNNAGVCVYGQFEWQTWKQCEQQVQVNLLGTMRLTRAFLPHLTRSKGRLVTVSSVNGRLAYPGLTVYSATKFALEGFSDALRRELEPQGVHVVTVRPGDYARATGIMSKHKQNARDMWDAMTEEERRRCGDFFHKYHRVTLQNFGLSSPNTLEGSAVLRDIQEAVLSGAPQALYVAAPAAHRMVYALLDLLPTPLTDYLIGKVVEALYKTEGKEFSSG